MQFPLICLVILLNLAFGALSLDIFNDEAIRVVTVTNLPTTSRQFDLAQATAGIFSVLPDNALDEADVASYGLAVRDDESLDSAQAGCWSPVDGDVKLVFGDGSTAMTTWVAADDFPYDLSIEGAEVFCTIPPDGTCDHCWRNTTFVQVRYAPENSWCYFLFTSEYAGTGYEGFYVHWYQDKVTLHNPGFIKIVMCHDADELKKKRTISAREDALSHTGCDSDPDSFQLALGMGFNNFLTYIPADGQNHRLGQPNPELRCANFGECKDCNDQADYVYLKSGAATSHCDLLFTETINGGYVYGVSITREQYRIDLPRPGVLAMATCFKPGQQRKESWISQFQTPPTTDGSIPPRDIAVIPETHDLVVRDDTAGCNGPQDGNHLQVFFGNDGFNFSTWVPIDSIPYKLGQPEPQLRCQRSHKDATSCVDCWGPVSWIYVPKVDRKFDCTVLFSENLNGGGMLQVDVQGSPIVYRLQKEFNLVLMSCNPATSASIEESAVQARAESAELVADLDDLIARDDSCGITDGSAHTKFIFHGGESIQSTLDVKNDGNWYVFGETPDATLLCTHGSASFSYCGNCQYRIDSMEQFGSPGVTCQLEFRPLPEAEDQFTGITWTLIGSAIINMNIPEGYYGRVKCNDHAASAIKAKELDTTSVERVPNQSREAACQASDVAHSTFTISGGQGADVQLDVPNDGQWHVFGEGDGVDLYCSANTGNIVYCDNCRMEIDSIIMTGPNGSKCSFEISPTDDAPFVYPKLTLTMTPNTIYSANLPEGYNAKVECDG